MDDVEGQSADMLVQRHIVSANQLLDKVEEIKDRMENGDLDARSNLGSMLNSVIENDLGP